MSVIIIASIVYLSAFSLMIKLWLGKKKKPVALKEKNKEETV